MFLQCPTHTTPGEFKNTTVIGKFGFVFEGNSVRDITRLSWRYCFRKVPFTNCFLHTQKRKAVVFKLFRLEECFTKATFSWRISVDGRSSRRNKAASLGLILRDLLVSLWFLGHIVFNEKALKRWRNFCKTVHREESKSLFTRRSESEIVDLTWTRKKISHAPQTMLFYLSRHKLFFPRCRL